MKNINQLKRNLIAILFLFTFMAAMLCLSGMSQNEINQMNKRPVVLLDYVPEELPELLEPVKIQKPVKMYFLIKI